jgi:hypothetical protein
LKEKRKRWARGKTRNYLKEKRKLNENTEIEICVKSRNSSSRERPFLMGTVHKEQFDTCRTSKDED